MNKYLIYTSLIVIILLQIVNIYFNYNINNNLEKIPHTNEILTQDSYTQAAEDSQVLLQEEDEKETEAYQRDEKLWYVNKGISMILDEYQQKNNTLPNDLSEISQSISQLEDIDFDKYIDRYEYTTSPDSLGNENACYTYRMKFESPHYAEHNNEDGYFTLTSPKATCR